MWIRKRNYGYLRTEEEDNYDMKRRKSGLINVIIITCVIGFLMIVMTIIASTNKDKTKKAFVKLAAAVQAKQEDLLENSHETCVNGMKVVIVNGITYYAGTVDTWGDVTTIMCE
jgi:flagellar basal body-associated protein FliL